MLSVAVQVARVAERELRSILPQGGRGGACGVAALVGVALCCPPHPLLGVLRPIPFLVAVICGLYFFLAAAVC